MFLINKDSVHFKIKLNTDHNNNDDINYKTQLLLEERKDNDTKKMIFKINEEMSHNEKVVDEMRSRYSFCNNFIETELKTRPSFIREHEELRGGVETLVEMTHIYDSVTKPKTTSEHGSGEDSKANRPSSFHFQKQKFEDQNPLAKHGDVFIDV
mmetsp:Transcript_30977/g.39879  ORF Transcript_30977/g.39879 Transcript_30977/m.39879 type:complete len:154 (+) Transcript_30977:3-464(+)